jgi:hypothetical protein
LYIKVRLVNINIIKRKQKWQLNRTLFKKRRFKRKFRFTLRFTKSQFKSMNRKFLFRAKLAANSQIGHKLTSTTPSYGRPSLYNSLTPKSSISRIANKPSASQINITDSSIPGIKLLWASKVVNLLLLSTNDIRNLISYSHQLPATPRYSLASKLLHFSPLDKFNVAQPYVALANATTSDSSRLYKSNMRDVLDGWSYNMRASTICDSPKYSSFITNDGFLAIVNLSNTLALPSVRGSRGLPLSKYVTTYSWTKTFSAADKVSALHNANHLPRTKTLIAREKRLIKYKLLRSRSTSLSRRLRNRKYKRLASREATAFTRKSLRSNTLTLTRKNNSKFYYSVRRNLTRLLNPIFSSLYSAPARIGPAGSQSAVVTHATNNQNGLLNLIYGGGASVINAAHMIPHQLSYVTNIYPDGRHLRGATSSFKPAKTQEFSFSSDVSPWINDSIVRLIEHSSGSSALLQHSMHAENMVDTKSKLEYKKWISRMAYYERNLGHRFFMEEALHIIHLSFRYHDVTLFSSWLKAIITRISFWKTRSIFRFLKYVFNNYYKFAFNSLSIKGIKIRLKGKISAAGNSRKRTILFRSGRNSYSSVNIKCLHEFKTITTFTGAMGFQVWFFY